MFVPTRTGTIGTANIHHHRNHRRPHLHPLLKLQRPRQHLLRSANPCESPKLKLPVRVRLTYLLGLILTNATAPIAPELASIVPVHAIALVQSCFVAQGIQIAFPLQMIQIYSVCWRLGGAYFSKLSSAKEI